jgi:hypothetical protein
MKEPIRKQEAKALREVLEYARLHPSVEVQTDLEESKSNAEAQLMAAMKKIEHL